MSETGPQKYRKKPVVVEAIRYRGEVDKHLVRDFVTTPIDEVSGGQGLSLATLEGWLHVSEGDWIIRGVQGEFCPCKPDIFEKTYDPVYENRSGHGWVAGRGPVPTNPPAKPARTPTAGPDELAKEVEEVNETDMALVDALTAKLEFAEKILKTVLYWPSGIDERMVPYVKEALAKIEEGSDA